MKKGIQYSHYCGTELQNLIDLAWLIKDDINNKDIISALLFLKELKENIENLRVKISKLDVINKMDY